MAEIYNSDQAHLLQLGHESHGISRNISGETPLHHACQSPDASPTNPGSVAVARLIIKSSEPSAVLIQDKTGMDALAHASKHGNTAVVQLLLSLPKEAFLLLLGVGHSEIDSDDAVGSVSVALKPGSHPLLRTRDHAGNTPLHHASAWGHLKAARLLVDAGLSATARNAAGWTPIEYSATVAAEVYLRNLMREKLGQLGLAGRAGSRANVGGLGANGRKVSGGVGVGVGGGINAVTAVSAGAMKGGAKSGMRLVESDRSDDDEEQRGNTDEAALGRARTFS